MKRLLLLTCALLLVASPIQAKKYSVRIDENAVRSGVEVNWETATVSISPGSFSNITRLRIQQTAKQEAEVPNLPKKFRTKQPVYDIEFSRDIENPVRVQLQYGGNSLKRRRVFFLAEGSQEWERLSTGVNQYEKTATATLPAKKGKVVVATHTFKKERPVKRNNFTAYSGTPYSDTAAVLDVQSGKFLYRQQAKKLRAIASISKVATALTFLEQNQNLDDLVTYTTENDRIGADVLLEDGEMITKKQVLMGTLIPSANNMAVTLSQSAGMTQDAFMQQVNTRMDELGLNKTHFDEPSGLDSDNISTAGNVAQLARYAFLEYPEIFQEAASTRRYQYYTSNTGRLIEMFSTNKFDGRGKYELIAFKTGYYPGTAERTLVVQARELETGAEVIAVLLGNPQYNTIFDEMYELLDWTFTNWRFPQYQ